MPVHATLTVPLDFPAYRYRAQLVRVIDGDTVRVAVDLGMRITREVSLRIQDIDAPEIFGKHATPEGRQSADTLAALLADKPLYVATEKDRKSFDRYVALIYVEGTDGDLVNIGQAMIEAGEAVAV